MIRLFKEKILQLQMRLAEQTGGSIEIRDEALLDAALENAFAQKGDSVPCPTNEEKAARLCHSLICNHVFVDGNKRIGMYVMITFLEVNGVYLDATNEDVVEAGLAVADGSMDYEALLAWVRRHRRR